MSFFPKSDENIFLDPRNISKKEIEEIKNDPPRFLTEEEIKNIMRCIPSVSAVSPDIAEDVRSQISEKLALQLSDLKVCPGAIPKLEKFIINQFNRSVIDPGETIGILLGEAIGGPITQMALDTFHQAGSLGSNISIKSFRELLAGGDRSSSKTYVHFKNKNLTFDDILNLRGYVSGITTGELIISREIFETKEIPRNDRGWWYSLYDNIFTKKMNESKYFLRIKLKTFLLFSYEVSLGDIVKVLESNGDVRAIPSPTNEGIIDIYPNESAVLAILLNNKSNRSSGIDEENSSLLFIQNSVIPSLNDYLIKGIPGISYLDPITSPTWRIVLGESRYMNDVRLQSFVDKLQSEGKSGSEISDEIEKTKRMWNIWISWIRVRVMGVPVEKLSQLLKALDIDILRQPQKGNKRIGGRGSDGRMIVLMPKDWEDVFTKKDRTYTPGDFIKYHLDIEEKKEQKEYDDQKEKGVLYPKIPVSKIIRYGTYVNAVVDGHNLKGLLCHPLVDPRMTISNSPHEVLSTFGIEAARNFIVFDFERMISSTRSYINPRYISLVADFMTNIGIIVPITSRGAARQLRGSFADASFERPLEIFIKAAITGNWEGISSTSTSIFLGMRGNFGTGLPKTRNITKILLRQQDQSLSVSLSDLSSLVGQPEYDVYENCSLNDKSKKQRYNVINLSSLLNSEEKIEDGMAIIGVVDKGKTPVIIQLTSGIPDLVRRFLMQPIVVYRGMIPLGAKPFVQNTPIKTKEFELITFDEFTKK